MKKKVSHQTNNKKKMYETNKQLEIYEPHEVEIMIQPEDSIQTRIYQTLNYREWDDWKTCLVFWRGHMCKGVH